MNFIKQVLQDPAEFRWSFALSQQVNSELLRAGVTLPDETEIFPISPARDSEARLRLRRLADRWKPDGVFTFAGPAYVNFKQPHLLGCMACWVTHGGWNAFRTISFLGNGVIQSLKHCIRFGGFVVPSSGTLKPSNHVKVWHGGFEFLSIAFM